MKAKIAVQKGDVLNIKVNIVIDTCSMANVCDPVDIESSSPFKIMYFRIFLGAWFLMFFFLIKDIMKPRIPSDPLTTQQMSIGLIAKLLMAYLVNDSFIIWRIKLQFMKIIAWHLLEIRLFLVSSMF